MDPNSRTGFFVHNLLRGLLILSVIIIGYIIFKKYFTFEDLSWLGPFYDNTFLVLLVYTLSEVFFGIIPPELFFIWATKNQDLHLYIHYIIILSVITYGAGLLGFWIGVKLNETLIYRWLKRKYLIRYQKHLNNYGFFVIIVAALTPLPFSGISMLMGSVNYPFRKFWIYAMSRFIRYAVYSFIFWEISIL